MSVTSVMPIKCQLKMSVTSVGGREWGVQIFTLIHFNTPFRSCFTKERIYTVPRINDYWTYFLLDLKKIYMDQVRRNTRQQQQLTKLR